MLITRTSILSRKTTTQELPVTQEQIDSWLNGGRNIQDVFPHLNADQREFLKTGITKEEWDAAFPEEE